MRRLLAVGLLPYRILLGLYPGPFRHGEGREMRRTLERALEELEGPATAVRLALRETLDLGANLPAAWLEELRGGHDRRRTYTSRIGEVGPMGGWDGWGRDVRQAVRGLIRRPGFSLVVIGTLGLAMGANATVFAVVEQVLLKPLPFEDADELVYLREVAEDGQIISVSYPNFQDWRERSRSFESLGARAYLGLTLAGEGPARELRGSAVTPGLMSLLGVRPLHGRLLEERDLAREERVAVLSWEAWQEFFAGDPEVVGRSVRMDKEPWQVVGVLPRGLEFPLSYDVYLPITAISESDRTRRSAHPGISVVGRLAENADIDEARREMETIAAALAVEYPDSNRGSGIQLTRLRDEYIGDAEPILLLLLGAVGLVLLIACANVANLFLARWAARQREAAVRTALGAGRATLVRGVLVEAVVLALAGSALGILLAVWGLQLFQSLQGAAVPRLEDATIDGTVLAFTMLAGLLAALAAGGIPALGVSRTDPGSALRAGTRGNSASGGGRIRRTLVIGEVAVSVALLTGAALMLRSVDNLMAEDPGLALEGVLTARVPMSTDAYPAVSDRARFFRLLIERVEALPGVEAVGGVDPLPLSGFNRQWTLSGEGLAGVGEEGVRVDLANVTPGYFETMGIRQLSGRPFTGEEGAEDTPVLVARTLAETFWPGQDPLGRALAFRNSEQRMHVIGVVEPVRHYGVTEAARMQLYRPYSAGVWSLNLVVRTRGEPASVVAPLRAILREMDDGIPLTRVSTMEELHRATVAEQLLMSNML